MERPPLSRTPLLTVTMAQFVHELGVEWHLMSATAVMAMIPALVRPSRRRSER
jgi:multiple sugar transport system permease protein